MILVNIVCIVILVWVAMKVCHAVVEFIWNLTNGQALALLCLFALFLFLFNL